MTSFTTSVDRSKLRRCAIAAILLAAAGGAGCGSPSYLQLTYRSTDVMLGTTDTTTLDGSSVERKSVQELAARCDHASSAFGVCKSYVPSAPVGPGDPPSGW